MLSLRCHYRVQAATALKRYFRKKCARQNILHAQFMLPHGKLQELPHQEMQRKRTAIHGVGGRWPAFSRSRHPLARQAESAAQGGTNRLNRQRGGNRTACSEPGDGGRRPEMLQPASPISSITSRSRTRALTGEGQPVNWSIGVFTRLSKRAARNNAGLWQRLAHGKRAGPGEQKTRYRVRILEQGPARLNQAVRSNRRLFRRRLAEPRFTPAG